MIQGIGNAIAGQIFVLIVVALVVGAVLALGGYFGISWLIQHVSIGWQP